MIAYTCPKCGNQLNIPDQYAGQQGKCNGCGGDISVPGLDVEDAFPGASSVMASAQVEIGKREKATQERKRRIKTAKNYRVAYFIIFIAYLATGVAAQFVPANLGLSVFVASVVLLFGFVFCITNAMNLLEYSLTKRILLTIGLFIPFANLFFLFPIDREISEEIAIAEGNTETISRAALYSIFLCWVPIVGICFALFAITNIRKYRTEIYGMRLAYLGLLFSILGTIGMIYGMRV